MVNKERLVEEFCSLVTIDSVSFHERKMADLLMEKLHLLGFHVIEDNAGDQIGGNCGNVYGYLEGNIQGEPLLFSAHMDTVEPGIGKKACQLVDGTITSDHSTVLGADDLSGIVAILEAIRSIQENGVAHRSLEVLFPVAEEAYIQGSNVFDFSIVKAKQAYVLDLDGPVGKAAIGAPTLVSFTAKFTGKAAHAGFAPEQGIHAISIAAKAITMINQGRIDDQTTVNIGIIEGGKARNIVPEECVLKGEVRSMVHEKALAITEQIRQTMETVALNLDGKLEFNTSFGCIAYEVSPNHPVVNQFEKACKELNYPTQLIHTFGGSDNNNFALHGITGIVLACGMNKVHSCEEYTHVEELYKCSNIIYKLMTDLGTSKE